MKILLASLLLIFALQVTFGQSNYIISAEENSYKHPRIYHGQDVYTDFNRYSKTDLINFSEKLNLLLQTKNIDWEGSYYRDLDEVGESRFIWSKNQGFINYYVYTCRPELRFVKYGEVKETNETVEVIPQHTENSPQKKQITTKYVKIKWSGREYLVEESSLSSFAEKAVGIYVEPTDSENENYNHWTNFWVRGDMEKELKGLPVFPSGYKKFERKPIHSKILSVEKRTIEEKELGNRWFSESAWYEVVIDGGSNLGIKVGMEFHSSKLENVIYITKVNSNTSVGLIQVEIDENKDDKCTDDNGNSKKCPKIQRGYKIETVTGYMYY